MTLSGCFFEKPQNHNYTNIGGDTGGGTQTSKPKTVQVGDTIKFGHWEQDGNYDNGEEEIEWIVLEVSNGKYLLLSKYALDGELYADDEWITFEKSNITEFLNDYFFYDAFTYLEEKKLTTGTITSNDGNYSPTDKVFALSTEEVEQYSKRVPSIYNCYPTKAAEDYVTVYSGDDQGKCYWWARDNTFFGTLISPDGTAWVGTKYNENYHGIRPAIWLEADYKIQIPQNVKISNDFLGKWYVEKGNDGHTITIYDDGRLSIEDGGDTETWYYTCLSPTEISLGNEFVFVLQGDEIIRYEESEPNDTYVYKKQ